MGASAGRLLALGALAVALTVSFYLIVFALLVGVVSGALYLVLAIGPAGAAAFAVPVGVLFAAARRAARASLPRRRLAGTAGVAVSREREPGLWAVVDEVCGAVGQRPIEELRVTLVGGASAAEFGSRLRRRHRRVLSVSLGYLQVLSVDELRVVVAHEVGHFAAGDTALGRWLVMVRGALGRTLRRLQDVGSVLRYPLRWYAHGFFRLTASMSRQREFAADALTARLYGAEATARALRVTAPLEALFEWYWRRDAAPALDAGLQPPLGEGFGLFVRASDVVTRISTIAVEGDAGRYDSHPLLSERLWAVRADAPGTPTGLDTAVALCASLDEIESALLREKAGDVATSLTATPWARVAGRVYPGVWERSVATSAWVPPAITAADIPSLFESADDGEADVDALANQSRVVACALGCALVRSGWSVERSPGMPSVLRRGDASIELLREVWAVARTVQLRAAWSARCEDLGIADLPLAPQRATSNNRPETPASLDEPLVFALDAHEAGGVLSRREVRLVSFAGVPLAALMFGCAFAIPSVAGAASLAVAGALILVTVAFVTAHRRSALRTPSELRIDGDELTVSHRQLLREPLRVPFAAIRVVSVDAGSTDRDSRFPVHSESAWDHAQREPSPRAWVWQGGRAAIPLPYYGLHKQAPNVLILLNDEVPGPGVRREKLHGPLNGETLTGLVLRIADPEAAAAALTDIGLARRLTINDIVAPRGRSNTATAKEPVPAGS
jgi:Zn-dependent protease with chaperone function